MKIFLFQLDIIWKNPEANYRKIRKLTRSMKIPVKSLLVLPEMFSTGFVTDFKPAALSGFKQSYKNDLIFISELAKKYKSFVTAGVITPAPNCKKLLNTCLVIDPQGKLIARYNKIHLFRF